MARQAWAKTLVMAESAREPKGCLILSGAYIGSRMPWIAAQVVEYPG